MDTVNAPTVWTAELVIGKGDYYDTAKQGYLTTDSAAFETCYITIPPNRDI
jgi:tRNA U34 5-methylaminomethyl-2-thiouridine-forming methyltransferase MnmC